MKNSTLVILSLLWIAALLVLIAALTDVFPSNIFKKHRFIVGIGFITLNGFLLRSFKMFGKKK